MARLVYLCLLAGAAALLYFLLTTSPWARQGELRFEPVDLDPTRTYVLEYWDYDYPLASEAYPDYDRFVRAMITAFNQRYPNVQVKYRLLDFSTGWEELQAALASGRPPDVYATWWDHPPVVHPLGVPVDPYLDEETQADYFPVAWSLASHRGSYWGWPRWVTPIFFYGHIEALQGLGAEAEEVIPEGLSWQALLELGQAAGEPVLACAAPGTLFRQLMLAQGIPSLLADDGRSLWGGQEFERAAEWIERLSRDGLLKGTNPDGRDKESGALEAFLRGEVAVVGGLNPAAAHLVLAWLQGPEQREPTAGLIPGQPDHEGRGISVRPRPAPPSEPRGTDPEDGRRGNPRAEGTVSLMPVPAPADVGALPVLGVGAVVVFRHADYRGLEQTQAAMEFARHVSQWRTAAPATSFLGVPALRASAEVWFTQAPLTPSQATYLYEVLVEAADLGYVRYPSAQVTIDERPIIREEVVPLLDDLWYGEVTAGEAVRRILELEVRSE